MHSASLHFQSVYCFPASVRRQPCLCLCLMITFTFAPHAALRIPPVNIPVDAGVIRRVLFSLLPQAGELCMQLCKTQGCAVYFCGQLFCV